MAQLLTGRADESRLGVSTESILQKERQLRVSERNMTTPIGKGFNDESKRGQTKIDLLCFLKGLACRSCLCDTLTSCQINEIQAACPLRAICVQLLVADYENGVTS